MSDEKKPQTVRPLALEKSDDETPGNAAARHVLRPEIHAAMTYGRLVADLPELNLTALVGHLETSGKAVAGGDVTGGERMLTAHAHVLDALFAELAQRALKAQTMQGLETYFRLAFKAQSQCRTTWESIGELLHPRTVAFVRADQANVACGPQQINVVARENLNSPNKLMDTNGSMDTRSQTPAIGSNSALETVAAIDGAAIKRRQGSVSAKRGQGKRPPTATSGGKTAAGGGR